MMIKHYLLIVIVGFSKAFTPTLAHADDRPPVTIFVPGLYGSTLAERDSGDLVWVNLGIALRDTPPIRVCDIGVTFKSGCAELEPKGVLDNVTVVPLIYHLNFYGELLEKLTGKIEIFPYDWRKSVDFNAGRLFQLLAKLRGEGFSVRILAHSLGGLVTAYALRYGDQPAATAADDWRGAKLVDRAIFATVPFQGSLMAVERVLQGRKVVLNETILRADAFATFSSMYQLLPTNDRAVLSGDSLKFVDITNPAAWHSQKIGLHAVAKEENIDGESASRATQEQLALARKIREKLHAAGQKPDSLKVLTIRGRGLRTKRAIIIGQKETAGDENAARLLAESGVQEFDDGDGNVLLVNSEAPTAYADKELVAEGEHLDIMTTPQVLKAVNDWLQL